MRSIQPAPALATLIVLGLIATVAPGAPAGETSPEAAPPAAAPVGSGPCGDAFSDLFAPVPTVSSEPAPGGGLELLVPLPQTIQPHCCSQQQVDACRSGCRDQGPGCKGQIGCRAGECVCTCTCPKGSASG